MLSDLFGDEGHYLREDSTCCPWAGCEAGEGVGRSLGTLEMGVGERDSTDKEALLNLLAIVSVVEEPPAQC